MRSPTPEFIMPRVAFTFFPCLILLAWTGSARAAEPQIAFAVEDGDIQIHVRRHDGTGVKATLRAFDSAGNTYAEGETEDNGQATFPPPPRGRCWIFVKIDKKEYDVIPLTVTKTTVEPPRVLLSLRTRACCRAPAVQRDETPSAASSEIVQSHWPSDWLLASLAGSGCVAAAGTLLVFRRRGLRPVSDPVSPPVNNPTP